MRPTKRKQQIRPRPGQRYSQPGPSTNTTSKTLSVRTERISLPLSAGCDTDGVHRARGRTACQQQVGNIGAGDQQHKSCDGHQKTQGNPILRLQAAHAITGRSQNDMFCGSQNGPHP